MQIDDCKIAYDEHRRILGMYSIKLYLKKVSFKLIPKI